MNGFRALMSALAFPTLALWACGDDTATYVEDTATDVGPDIAGPDAELPDTGEDTGPDVDPCGPCDTPPASSCEGDVRVGWLSPGTCESGTCAYLEVRTPCSLGCSAGACIGDPCEGVTCDDPPHACRAETGTCTSGTCSYAPLSGTTCDDEDPCTVDDTCAGGTCAGTPLRCESPPAPRCLDADRLEVFASVGTCGDGECTYAATPVLCPGGCESDTCVGDPCADVTCDTPPNACYDAEGACANGVCTYEPDNGIPCDDGDACTTGDTCQAGVCQGVAISCTTPDFGATCADADTRRTPVVPGTCEAGTCSYATQDTACSFGCDSGACVGDPCANVTCDTPPAPTCQGSTLRTATSGSGACSGGSCTWAFTETACANGCTAGACIAPTGLLISEVLYDSTGFPDTDSFLEIHGPPGTPLSGVSIVGINGNGGAEYVTIPLSGQTGQDGLYVIAHPDAEPFIADVADVFTPLIDLQNGPDSVQLRFGSQVLDALAYGNFGQGDVAAGRGRPAVAAPVNQSLARDHLFTNTDDNFDDFKPGQPTPAAPTPPRCGPPCLNGGTCVAVNTCECAAGWTGATCADAEQTEPSAGDLDPNAPAGFQFRYIPAGTYQRGSPVGELGRSDDETQHQVTLTRSFWMQETEVTQGQWKARSGGVNPSCFQTAGSSSCSTSNNNDTAPVERVSWFSALGYANALSLAQGLPSCYTLTGCTGTWQAGTLNCTGVTFDTPTGGTSPLDCAGYRLPTESEWEYAARAGTTTATYVGNLSGGVNDCTTAQANLDDIAWWCRNSDSRPRPVSGKTANAWGLRDMLGNVWEWTLDRYGTYPGTVTNPLGPASGSGRVNRGGSWRFSARGARAAGRNNYGPSYRDVNLGFRLSRTVIP